MCRVFSLELDLYWSTTDWDNPASDWDTAALCDLPAAVLGTCRALVCHIHSLAAGRGTLLFLCGKRLR